MLEILLLSVISWRVTYFLVNEDGPYFFMDKLRSWSLKYGLSPLHCFYCTSIWVGMIVILFSSFPILYGLALSGIAVFINLLHDRLH